MKPAPWPRRPIARGGWLWLLLFLGLAACGPATRALVHEDDMAKVFPWPRDKSQVEIRVKPLTTAARTCVLFGSYQPVQVSADTTFYVTDSTGKDFAYTPSRSPMQRLAEIESIRILWPQVVEKPAPEEAPAADASAPASPPQDSNGNPPGQ